MIFRIIAGVHALAQFDDNGDGLVDGEVLLRGITVLGSGDFIL